jgi:hypothetical protein
MRFDLPYGKGKLAGRCFYEEIKKNTMVVGNYSIVNPNEGHPLPVNHTIIAQVLMYSPFCIFNLFLFPIVDFLIDN